MLAQAGLLRLGYATVTASGRRAAVAAAASARPFSWESLARKSEGDPEAKAEHLSLKAACDAIEKDFETYAAPVPPINWAHYKKVIQTPGFVDYLQKQYESIPWDEMKPKMSEEDQQAMQKAKAEVTQSAKEYAAKYEEIADKIRPQLKHWEDNRIDRDTLVDEIWERFPGEKEEVLGQIENHEWFKDMK